MSLMHSLLAGALRFAGRHADAQEVEAAASGCGSRPAPPEPPDEIPPSAPLEPTPAALVIHGDERDVASGYAAPAADVSAGSSSAGSEAANGPAAASAASAEAGGTATAWGGAGAGSAEGEDREGKPESVQEHAATPQQQPHEQPSNLHDDPLAGIHSERLRQRIESDAFKASSGAAQDSAIASAADRLLQPELRSVLTRDVPPIDTTPAARQARIAALGGEIPKWARGDLENDPAVIRAMSAARDSKTASNSAVNGVRLREPAKAPAPASTAATAQRIGQRVVSEPAQVAAQSPAQLPKQLPSQPSRAAAGRDLER